LEGFSLPEGNKRLPRETKNPAKTHFFEVANISYYVCLAEDWDWKSQNPCWKSFPTRVLQKTLPPLPKTGLGKKKPVPTEGTNTIKDFWAKIKGF
jgi:hypothetical protein